MAVALLDVLVFILGITVTAVLVTAIWFHRKLEEGPLLHDFQAVDDTIQDAEIGMAMTVLMAFGSVIFILHGTTYIESIMYATTVLAILFNTVLAAVLYRFVRRIG